jgi:hypothetical protein
MLLRGDKWGRRLSCGPLGRTFLPLTSLTFLAVTAPPDNAAAAFKNREWTGAHAEPASKHPCESGDPRFPHAVDGKVPRHGFQGVAEPIANNCSPARRRRKRPGGRGQENWVQAPRGSCVEIHDGHSTRPRGLERVSWCSTKLRRLCRNSAATR